MNVTFRFNPDVCYHQSVIIVDIWGCNFRYKYISIWVILCSWYGFKSAWHPLFFRCRLLWFLVQQLAAIHVVCYQEIGSIFLPFLFNVVLDFPLEICIEYFYISYLHIKCTFWPTLLFHYSVYRYSLVFKPTQLISDLIRLW